MGTVGLRVCDHFGAALVFSNIAVVLVWLASRRFVGHRWLMYHLALFCFLRSLLSVFLMQSTYRGDVHSVWVTALLTASTICGITSATHVMQQSEHLKETLTRSEADEMMRQDHRADADQLQVLVKYLAEQNSAESNDTLMRITNRGVL